MRKSTSVKGSGSRRKTRRRRIRRRRKKTIKKRRRRRRLSEKGIKREKHEEVHEDQEKV